MIAVVITREYLAEAIHSWRQEWDDSPNQFLLSEQFRQSDAATYADQVAEHLFSKLVEASNKRIP